MGKDLSEYLDVPDFAGLVRNSRLPGVKPDVPAVVPELPPGDPGCAWLPVDYRGWQDSLGLEIIDTLKRAASFE